MKKSVIEPANVLQKKLFEIPAIVTSFGNQESYILKKWLHWLEELESIFEKYNFTQCAEIAGYRASIISSYSLVTEKRTQKRKQINQSALSTIQPVQQILSDKSNELNEKINQVRTLIKQILIPAKDAGMINYDPKTDFTAFIETLLIQFKSHDQVRSSINSAIALIGKYDVMRILAEEIEL